MQSTLVYKQRKTQLRFGLQSKHLSISFPYVVMIPSPVNIRALKKIFDVISTYTTPNDYQI